MLKGYKYRIFPTDDQKDQLQRYFGVNRLVYNLGLETKTSEKMLIKIEKNVKS